MENKKETSVTARSQRRIADGRMMEKPVGSHRSEIISWPLGLNLILQLVSQLSPTHPIYATSDPPWGNISNDPFIHPHNIFTRHRQTSICQSFTFTWLHLAHLPTSTSSETLYNNLGDDNSEKSTERENHLADATTTSQWRGKDRFESGKRK